MEISLDPDRKKFIENQIAQGQFKDENEALNEAVRLLEEQNTWSKAEIEKGLNSPSKPWDIDLFLKKAHKRADESGLGFKDYVSTIEGLDDINEGRYLKSTGDWKKDKAMFTSKKSNIGLDS